MGLAAPALFASTARMRASCERNHPPEVARRVELLLGACFWQIVDRHAIPRTLRMNHAVRHKHHHRQTAALEETVQFLCHARAGIGTTTDQADCNLARLYVRILVQLERNLAVASMSNTEGFTGTSTKFARQQIGPISAAQAGVSTTIHCGAKLRSSSMSVSSVHDADARQHLAAAALANWSPTAVCRDP